MPEIGQTLSHYRVIEKLGGGGMGVVYKAIDTKLGRNVALKFLPEELSKDRQAVERFQMEARAASALDHPNICTIHEIDEYEGQHFIAMQYLDGKTLKQRIAEKQLQIDEILDLAIQISDGLHVAHSEGIIHRDIKPANIFITDKNQVKILDFGLAKLLVSPSSSQGNLVTATLELTRSGIIMGTVSYMSPEQARGQQVDHRSDLFSFGIVLYEMLTGEIPFKAPSSPEILNAIINKQPPQLPSSIAREATPQLQRILDNCLAKDPIMRYERVNDLKTDLHEALRLVRPAIGGKTTVREASRSLLQLAKKPKYSVIALAVILLISITAVFYINRSAKRRWARDTAIPQIEQLAEQGNYADAFSVAVAAELYIPDDPTLASLLAEISVVRSITTTPPGADVYLRKYGAIENDWKFLGKTPINSARIPRNYMRWRIMKDGFETVDLAKQTNSGEKLNIELSKIGEIEKGMVRTPGGDARGWITGIDPIESIRISGFLIDKYEVTNREFMEFINNNGYQNKGFWEHDFIKDGLVLSWEKAMMEFRDATGRLGPATWQVGIYPEGQENYPVTGISWYEAAAYAEFANKSLPTIYHWIHAAGTNAGSQIIPLSNFADEGPAPIGSHEGMSPFGTYDMAGNVREWCWNSAGANRWILGGAWSDPTYMFTFANAQSPWDRSPTNGIRCVKYLGESIPDTCTAPVQPSFRDYSSEEPVTADVFEVYKNQFTYDPTDLRPVIESTDETSDWHIKEKISFDAAYGKERIYSYLLLPRSSHPPYQTVVLFPGSGAIVLGSSDVELSGSLYGFVTKSGRALMLPIYKGTYERNDGLTSTWPRETHEYAEYLIKWVKDLKRSIDYLETREDIDATKLAYFGFSWGGRMGAIIPAVEQRLKVSLIYAGGLAPAKARPEVDQINYITHVKIPVLMLNGKYDSVEPIETAQEPMFRLWGTPEKDKRWILYDTDHGNLPTNESIGEMLDWLDRYLGPVTTK